MLVTNTCGISGLQPVYNKLGEQRTLLEINSLCLSNAMWRHEAWPAAVVINVIVAYGIVCSIFAGFSVRSMSQGAAFNSSWPHVHIYLGHQLRYWIATWRLQFITWNNTDFSIVMFHAIHLRAISQRESMFIYCRMIDYNWNITSKSLKAN